MIKRKSTVYSSQTVFHNVCSEHTVLFLCLYNLGRKVRHEATTQNCDSTKKSCYHVDNSLLWRRGWDSNPRPLAESLVFKTSSLNHSDTSPNIKTRYSLSLNEGICQLEIGVKLCYICYNFMRIIFFI